MQKIYILKLIPVFVLVFSCFILLRVFKWQNHKKVQKPLGPFFIVHKHFASSKSLSNQFIFILDKIIVVSPHITEDIRECHGGGPKDQRTPPRGLISQRLVFKSSLSQPSTDPTNLLIQILFEAYTKTKTEAGPITHFLTDQFKTF